MNFSFYALVQKNLKISQSDKRQLFDIATPKLNRNQPIGRHCWQRELFHTETEVRKIMKSLKRFICTIGFLTLLGACVPVEADQPIPSGNQIQDGPIKALLDSQKQQAEARINARISDLEYAVELSAQQVEKLKATRSDAVTSFMNRIEMKLTNKVTPDTVLLC